MTSCLRIVTLWFAVSLLLSAADPAVIISRRAAADFALTADPTVQAWTAAQCVSTDKSYLAETVPNHHTTICSRWTGRNLYFLFVCPYEALHLKPDPVTNAETNALWNWDVAEIFLGSDFQHIRHYYEFEVSPQGEWVDLDINRDSPLPNGGVSWNSGFESKTRIDREKKIWYVEMRIPIASVDQRPAAAGLEYRINFYRCQGSGSDRKYIAWQPTGRKSFHVPEAFGRMKLE